MTIKDICGCLVSELQITFDEDPHDGQIDVIVPVCANPEEILSPDILELNVHLLLAKQNAIIISTCTR